MDRLEKENSPPRRNLRRQNHGITNLGEQQEVQPAAASMPPSQLEGNLSISSVASTAGSATSASSSVSSFPISPRHALPTVKRKSRREHRQSNYKHGKWTRDERLLFLKGVRAYGWGRWKEIGGTFLTTRCVQSFQLLRFAVFTTFSHLLCIQFLRSNQQSWTKSDGQDPRTRNGKYHEGAGRC